MVSKKQKKDIEEMANLENDIHSDSEASFDRDLDFSRSPQYSSEDMPTDIYRYKRMRLVPNSEAEFPGLIDKDVVLANIKDKKPDPDYLRFIAETIVAMEVFQIEVEDFMRDKDGNIVHEVNKFGIKIARRVKVSIPDPEFDVIRNFLRASLKSDLTLSRAMGKDREAVLDRTQSFSKEIKRQDKQNKYGGG